MNSNIKPLLGFIAAVAVSVSLLAPISAEARSFNGDVSFDSYITVNPIMVCDDGGLNCTSANTYAEYMQEIYAQAGVAVIFLPTTTVNRTSLLAPAINTDASFRALTDTAGNGQSTDASTINAWFLKTLAATNGTLYGQGWIGGNGVAINSTAVNSFNGGVGRVDTVAHEVGHNLGLDHTTFGAGGATNLMTTGSNRTIPSALGDVAPNGGKLDELNATQISQVLLSPFVKTTPKVTVDINGSTPFQTNDFFSVSFDNSSPNVFLQSMTIDLSPIAASFHPTGGFFDPTDNPPGFAGSPFLTSNLFGLAASDISIVGGQDGSQKLTLNFLPGTFAKGDRFKFGIDIDLFSCVDCFGVVPADLAGSLFTFKFSDGFGSMAAMSGTRFSADSTRVENLDLGSGVTPASQPPTGFEPPPMDQRVLGPIDVVPEPGVAFVLLIGLGFLGFAHFKLRAGARRAHDSRRFA